MKLKQTILAVITVATGLTSCEKDLYDPSQNKTEVKIENLKIGDNFDWLMTQKATCKLAAEQAVNVSIYQDEACKVILASTSVIPGNNIQLPLSVIKNSSKVYLQVDGESKVYPVSVNTDGSFDFHIPANQTTRAITRAESDFENHGTTIFYPNGSWGTVMFEDNYPAIGDYDFNDFVASYMVEIHTYPGTSYIKAIQFYMAIHAIGATYSYIPHLRIKSFEKSIVKSIKVNKEMSDLDVKMFADGKGDGLSTGKIVLAFNGAEDKKGQQFLNTEKGSQYIPGDKFDVTLTFAEEDQLDIAFIYADKFDIFLADKNRTKEIHMLGYGPAFANGNDYNNNNYYKQAGTNLVWGINVPSIIGHAYEKCNFLDAYPDFAKWVQNDTNANEWYKNQNGEYIFQMK